MKNEHHQRLGLQFKVAFTVTLALLTLAAVLVYNYSQQMAADADAEEDKRAAAIITGLAGECEYPLLVGNKALVQHAVTKVLAQADVDSAVVFNEKGKVMAAVGHVDVIAENKVGADLVAHYKGTRVQEPGTNALSTIETYYLPVYLQPTSVPGGADTDELSSDSAKEVGQRLGLIELNVSVAGMQRAVQQARIAALMIAAILALIVSAVCMFIVRHMVRPLRGLVAGTQELAAGNLAVRVAAASSDELGELAQAFNEMAGSLQQSRAKILDQQGHLEQRVKDRTAELEKEIAEHRESEERLKHVLEELRDTQQQVIQQERLRALGGMASGIAHDFNNALVSVLGFSELLLQHPETFADTQKTRQYVEMMNTSAKDAGNIVNRLREFYRHREGREVFGMIDLNQLIAEAITLTQPRWKAQAEARNVTVTIQKDLQDIPFVAGNASELREVLTNLIFNAVDAMPRGGTIVIRTRSDAKRVTFEVSDTGTGMTDEVRQRCLEPFFTTKGEHGTGLGLSMVYGTVQRHRGTVDIESKVGQGSTFIIRLPHQPPEPQSAPLPQPMKVLPHLRVLVVDDEPMVCNIISEYLKSDGHSVEVGDRGRSGLEKFRSGPFDLVIVDRAMPDMGGDQVAAAIRSIDLNIPIIMLTGFGGMMNDAEERPAGVDLVVGKPVTIDGLRSAVTEAVGLHPPCVVS